MADAILGTWTDFLVSYPWRSNAPGGCGDALHAAPRPLFKVFKLLCLRSRLAVTVYSRVVKASRMSVH